MKENVGESKLLGYDFEDAVLYKALLYSSPDAIVIYDLQGNVLFINSIFTKIFGYTFEDLKGKKIPFVPEEEKERTWEIIKKVLSGEVYHAFETKRFTKDGNLVDISISGSRIVNDNGNVIGMLVILRDITERNKLKVKLNQMERLESIGRLAGGIAHDFNNLLMGLQGNLDILKLKLRRINQWKAFEKYVATMTKLVDSGQKLTRQLLEYARKGSFRLEPLNINLLLKNIVYTFGRAKKQIKLNLILDENIKLVKADEGQIEQVFYNLLLNAVDSIGENDTGEITITSKVVKGAYLIIKEKYESDVAEEYVLVTVKDSGIGMDKETMKHIFEPFFTTKKRNQNRGVGLGLSSVYGIIKAHKGFIFVESEIGKGSNFKVFLPVINKKNINGIKSSKEKNILEINQIKKNKKYKILIVDDEEDILDSIKELLEEYGYEVYGFLNGFDALDFYRENKFSINVIIIDMLMPEIGGIELLEEFKKINAIAKFIISSGYIVDETIKQKFKDDSLIFLQKPYNSTALISAIES